MPPPALDYWGVFCILWKNNTFVKKLYMYSSVNIANYFIEKAIYEGVMLTPMKVLKLVYIAHGWYLGLFKKPLITEQTEAWKYGPVVPSIYHKFKMYGNKGISQVEIDVLQNKEEYEEIKEDKRLTEFLDKIWEVYKKYTAIQLSALTHKTGTPWYKTWHENGGSLRQGVAIPNKLIEEYYIKESKS